MASIRTRRREDGKKTYQVRGEGIKTRTFDRRDDARRYQIDAARRRMLGELYEAAPESFGAILDSYVDRKSATAWRESTSTAARETATLLDPLRATAVSALRRAEAEDVIARVARRAPRRAQQARMMLLASLKDARARGHRIDEAVLGIPQVRYDEREARFLSLDQLEELESWMPEYIRRIIPVAGLTGMREGELFSLIDSDLHLDDAYLEVRRGKTRAARRRVRLPAEVVKLLREQLLARPQGTQLVFPTPTGLRWDRRRFMGRVYRPARVAAGLHGVTFHDLRHSAVSIMAVAGWRPEHIAKQIGHTDGGALIFKKYRHLFAGEIEQAAEQLDAFIVARAERSA